MNDKRRVTTSRTNRENDDLVSVSVDGSHEDHRKHKAVIYLLSQNKATVDLIKTSNYEHKSVHTDDNEEYYLPLCNLRNSDNGEND